MTVVAGWPRYEGTGCPSSTGRNSLCSLQGKPQSSLPRPPPLRSRWGGRGDRPSQASSCLTDGPLRRPESSLAGGWGAPEPLKCPGPWSPSADTLSPSYTLAGTSLRWPQSGRGGGGPGEAAEAPPGWARGPQMESRRPVPRARRSRRRPGPHSDYSAFPLSGRPLMAGWAGRGRKCRLPGPLTRLERRPRPRQPPAPAAHCSTAVLGTSDLWGGGPGTPSSLHRRQEGKPEAGSRAN